MSDISTLPDRVFAQPLDTIHRFRFDEQVAEVFPDMIQRSIPGYQTILDTLGIFTQKFATPDANYYDLGCSLGAATQAMRRNINYPGGTIYAIDNSEAMLKRCQQHVNAFNYTTPVKFINGDINMLTIENAAIVVLNFTLQFLTLEQRQPLLNKIYQGLKPGGLLFLSEKLFFRNSEMNELLTNLYHDFKRRNGYSDLEISQKRSALENVLRPDTLDTHYQRLKTAGFNTFNTWYQQLNFCSLIAVKDV